jgi:hypothetical protein
MSKSTGASDQRFWIVSPVFDLCFVINLWWLLALLPQPQSVGISQSTPVEFWQIYFLTAPHRWITLVLVATDPDRREGRTWVFVALAVVAAVVVLAAWIGLESFSCLVLADFIWNAWHFASQHGGILRIYGRMGGGGRPVLERWGFRVFVTYTALRTAGWLTGLTEHSATARATVSATDYGILVLPALLVALELIDRPWQRRGKVLYLTSVVLMYTALLFAIRSGDHFRVIAMSAGSAAFHAVEYMAIVTFYAWRRQQHGSQSGAFRTMTGHWLRILALYMITLGIISQYVDRNMKDLYIGLNLWAAFLHYAYDGMIWKLRRAGTAQALNVQLNQTTGSSSAVSPS